MSEWKYTEIGKIPIDAELVQLESCLDLIIDHRGKTPIKMGGNWVNEGIRAISAKNVHDGKLTNHDDIRYVTFDMYKKWMKEDIKKGDCLLASEGATLGEHLYWDYDFPVVLSQRLFGIRTNPKKLDPKYFYAFVTSDYFQNQIHGKASGTSVFGLRQTEVRTMLVSLIPLERQKIIGEIHYYLNKKIDLLHRQNATLEKMAETLFRQWFVKEAKEDWEIGKVSDFALHFKDSIQPQKKHTTLYSHYSIPSYDNSKTPIKELGSEIQSNKYKVPAYCILFSKLNPHKDKRVWLLQNEVESNGICSTEFQVVLPKKKQHLYFLYGWLSLNDNYNEIASGVGGTSGSHQRIEPKTIYEYQCPLITDDEVERYNIQIEPVFKKQVINQNQIRTLTALRDNLLPKLMSGEVKVI
jgi:type I restriction enzyme S subunit